MVGGSAAGAVMPKVEINAYQHLFSTWIEHKGDFDVSHVRDALSAFGRLIHKDHKRLFEDIFKILEAGLSKLGDTAAK